MKILSIFTHLCVIPNLVAFFFFLSIFRNTKDEIVKNLHEAVFRQKKNTTYKFGTT